MQKMLVGQYKHISEFNIKDLIHDVLNDKLFGFVEVDIKVPDELYDKFSEMSPVMRQMKTLLVVTCLIIVNKIKYHYIQVKN